jgi:hypothetical protein
MGNNATSALINSALGFATPELILFYDCPKVKLMLFSDWLASILLFFLLAEKQGMQSTDDRAYH